MRDVDALISRPTFWGPPRQQKGLRCQIMAAFSEVQENEEVAGQGSKILIQGKRNRDLWHIESGVQERILNSSPPRLLFCCLLACMKCNANTRHFWLAPDLRFPSSMGAGYDLRGRSTPQWKVTVYTCMVEHSSVCSTAIIVMVNILSKAALLSLCPRKRIRVPRTTASDGQVRVCKYR